MPSLEKKSKLWIKLSEESFYWPNSRKENRFFGVGGGKEVAAEICVLLNCCLIPLSLFQLKALWSDVLPVLGIGWGGGVGKLKLGLSTCE